MTKLNFFGASFLELRESLSKDLLVLDNLMNTDIDIYFDLAKVVAQAKSFKVLVLLEPPSVMPENYEPRALEKFDLVIPLSPWRASSMGLNSFAFQPIAEPPLFLQNSDRQEAIIFVNALKFGSVRSSLYGWRLEILRKLEQAHLPIEVYGPNWDMTFFEEIRKRISATRRAFSSRDFKFSESWSNLFYRPKSYKGEAPDKINTISKFRFALVVENDTHALTEKIFDALYSGAIVFYRGPKLGIYTNLERFCFSLPEDPGIAVEMIREVLSRPKEELIHKASTINEDLHFFEPFTLKRTSLALASIIASEVKSLGV